MGPDKLLHFVAGIGISLTVSFGAPKSPGVWRLAPMPAVAFAAIGKELVDRQQPHKRFDSGDVLATLAGGLTGEGLRFAFDQVKERRAVTLAQEGE